MKPEAKVAGVKSEEEVRQMVAILSAFNSHGKHDEELRALRWVLNEYPEREGGNCKGD